MARDAAPPRDAPPAPARAGEVETTLEAALALLESHVRLLQGRVEKVLEACATVEGALAQRADLAAGCYARLAGAVSGSRSPCAEAVRAFLARQVLAAEDPAPLLGALLRSASGPAAATAALEVVEQRRLPLDEDLFVLLAGAGEVDASLLERLAYLAKLHDARSRHDSTGRAALESLLEPSVAPAARRLAARVLDRAGAAPRSAVVRGMLGAAAYRTLAPLLDFTCATHEDLVALTPGEGQGVPSLPAITEAEAALDAETLGRFIAALGWPSVSRGFRARQLVALSLGDAHPFLVELPEAPLIEACGPFRHAFERQAVVAHGGDGGDDDAGTDLASIRRFRAYNLAHAELLGEILAVEPVTPAKARRILALADRIVADFATLFAAHDEEARHVAAVYAPLRERVEAACRSARDDEPLPLDVTREVQAFEDPSALHQIRTLHGLKRFLHQRGLRNAFRLFRAGSVANRTVDLAAAAPGGPIDVVRPIRYIDFEPTGDGSDPPYIVRLLAEAFLEQVLQGVKKLPAVEVLIFGTEVQIYVRYRNHPAFVRLDLSPPLRGGMLDLEYFAVSQYEMTQHPDLELPAIQCFLRRLGCFVELDGFRLHARYDKEQARNLGELLEAVTAVFRLLPYLMDLDWAIGSLDLPPTARRRVAETWSELFAAWGVLPLEALLTSDRRGVLVGGEREGVGGRELRWDGQGTCPHRFAPEATAGVRDALRRVLRARRLGVELPGAGTATAFGQRELHRTVLAPLRDAVAAGALTVRDGRFEATGEGTTRREHEAARFAHLLAAQGEPLRAAVRLAGQLRALERHLLFQPTGTLNGFPVERATVVLEGEALTLFALRDGQGVIRLLEAVRGATLLLSRGSDGTTKAANLLDPADLLRRLRRSNFLTPGGEAGADDAAGGTERLAAVFSVSNPRGPGHPDPGDRVARGVPACPGRAAGPARFDVRPSAAAMLDGAVLVAPAVGPADAPLLRRAAALVSTGGGVLSHLGTVALELGKPSVVAPGRWETPPGGTPTLHLRRLEFEEEERTVGGFRLSCWSDLREHEEGVHEGDLLVVDGDMGLVWLLGGDREALAIHQELQQLRGQARRGDAAAGDEEALRRRGRLLRASHALGRLAEQTARPALARYLAWELLLDLGEAGVTTSEHQRVLGRLLANPACGEVAGAAVARLVDHLRDRLEALAADATTSIPRIESPHEIAFVRLAVMRLAGALGQLEKLGVAPGAAARAEEHAERLEAIARRRLEELRSTLAARLAELPAAERWQGRHLARTAALVKRLLGGGAATIPDPGRGTLASPPAPAGRLVVRSGEGGAEMAGEIGAKAANLDELTRILGGTSVPAWFAVTDRAFRLTLAAPPPPRSADPPGRAEPALGDAIAAVLARDDLDPGRQSRAIRSLWGGAALPREVAEAVLGAYRALADPAAGGARGAGGEAPMVAVRSSSREEDTEAAAWAGQFDTFLYVSGEASLLDHVKLAWAGLWSERALHQRRSGASLAEVGGGVIVQRMVNARVAGVLHTVSAATGQVREMVVNVGLGLGEGVVSGAVEVDQVFVSKDTDPSREPLRLRYLVADKRTRFVFDERRGCGTCCRETLFHQRMRPALEYAELYELVRTAARIEAVYLQPLDIEFAYQEGTLAILQVRPVAVFRRALEDTLERVPLHRETAVAEEVRS